MLHQATYAETFLYFEPKDMFLFLNDTFIWKDLLWFIEYFKDLKCTNSETDVLIKGTRSIKKRWFPRVQGWRSDLM